MSAKQPFMPHYGSTQQLAPAAGSASVSIDPTNQQVRIWNSGANKCYVRTYDSNRGAVTQSATVADCPIAPGEVAILTKGLQHDRLAHISAAGTTIEVTTGDGWS